MIHYLTVGRLDTDAVRSRKRRAVDALPVGVRELAISLCDEKQVQPLQLNDATDVRATHSILPRALKEHALSFAVRCELVKFEGDEVLLTSEWVVCMWYSPGLNCTSARFALQAIARYECIAVDVDMGAPFQREKFSRR